MHKWSRFSKLTAEERKTLLQALALLPTVHVLLKLIGLQRLLRLIEAKNPLSSLKTLSTEDEMLPRARSAARIVSIAADHGLYRATCLRRSLVLWILLRRQGIESSLCFGTRLRDKRLDAHAWIELQGVVVNDHQDIRQQFPPLEDGLPTTRSGL